jgi:hypothetical protein
MIKIARPHKIIRESPSSLVTLPSTTKKTEIIRITTSEIPTTANLCGISLQKRQKKGIRPKTNVIWVFTDPKLSPTDMSPWPKYEEKMLLTISGKSDPIDENIKPTVNIEAPNRVAIFMRLSTAVSLEMKRIIRPRISPSTASQTAKFKPPCMDPIQCF